MATSIANLAVLLTAKTEPFGRGLRKASKDLTSFVGSIAGATVQVLKYSAGLAAVGAAATTVFTKKAMSMMDTTGKLSDRLGIATEDLIGLRHAAELAGGGADLLDDSLEKLGKNLGDPSKEVQESLEKMGLSVVRLRSVDPAEQFKLIAEGVSKLGSQEEKAAVSSDLFGKSSLELITLLEQGRAGIEEMQKDAEKLGITFSRIDAAKVEEANDAFTRLGALFEGVFVQVAKEFSPLLTLIVNKFIDAATESGGFGSIVARVMQGIVNAIDTAVDSIKGFALELKRAGSVGLRTLGDLASFSGMFGGNAISKGLTARAEAIDREVGKQRALREMKKPGTQILDLYNKLQSEATKRAQKNIDDAKGKRDNAKQAAQAANDAKLRAMFSNGLAATQSFVKDLGMRAAGMRAISGYGQKAKDWWNGQVARAQAFMMRQPASQITGTRGTFSGETAGRMQATYSISVQQLQEAKRQSDLLEKIIEGVNGGAVVGP